MITIDDYRIAIKKHFDATRDSDGFPLSLNPTPAELKNRAIALAETKLSEIDRNIIMRFFEQEEQLSIKKMDVVSPDKFRPVKSVYLTDVQSKSEPMLNMAALLVDFQPRPYRKFRQGSAEIQPELSKPEKAHVTKENTTVIPESAGELTFWDRHKRKAIAAVAAVALGTMATIGFRKTESGCMQWQTDHYERVDCQTDPVANHAVIGFVESQSKIRRIKVYRNTVFFREQRPVLWYLKHDGVYEFFDRPGYHPVLTDRPLLPVSRYIAMKVHDGEIKIEY